MKMTVILFQIDVDRFSAIAVDVDHQSNIWKTTFDSRVELVRRLDQAGLITLDEMQELRKHDWFSKGPAVFRVTLNREDIEEAGFLAVEPRPVHAEMDKRSGRAQAYARRAQQRRRQECSRP